MTIQSVLAWLVIFVAMPVLWIEVAGLLRLLRANPGNRVLRAQLLATVFMATLVTVFAGVFLNNGMEDPILGPPETMIVTRVMILSLVIPALYWLYQYRRRPK